MSNFIRPTSLNICKRLPLGSLYKTKLRCHEGISVLPSCQARTLPTATDYKVNTPTRSCRAPKFPVNQLSALNTAFSGHQRRFYRCGSVVRNQHQDDDSPSQKHSPQLMNFPWVIWPSILHTIRNWILSNLLIYRYLDQEFSLSSFTKGAVQALIHVSQEVSKGNFDAVEDLFQRPTLEEIKSNFSHFSMKQRLDLAVEEGDIFLFFPYQIGIIFTNEGSASEKIFVEITMCYHMFRGFQDYIKSKAEGTTDSGQLYDNHDRISIANYRFIREFTKGVDDDWTITVANHFKPGDMMKGR